ncbi:MAG: hypothetical protein JWP82_2005 [Humibacillus sp.]|nr:hypothetical protein [Humibacillus sp.]
MKTIKRVPERPVGGDGADPTSLAGGPDGLLHPVDPQPARLSRAHKVWLGVFFALLAVIVIGSLVKLPYAVMSPGPTVNTLGDSPGTTKPIITVTGLPTYPTDGALKFTTVRVAGGPGYPVDVWDLVRAWADPTEAIYPVDDLFDPTVSKEQVAEQNAVQMEGSQEEATAVAFRALGKTVPTHIVVSGFATTSKAKEVLRNGDRLVSVGGTPATSAESVRAAVRKVAPGAVIRVVVQRAGAQLTADLPTVADSSGRPVIGIGLGIQHDFPAKVTIDAGAVGGPSAGLMFSLGIYDKLTPGGLTAHHDVAGTGTINEAGQVGPIGGIRQKLAGARDGGADFFLAPADNCDEVVGHVPDGLTVVKVATFDEGLAAVTAIAGGTTGSLPHC